MKPAALKHLHSAGGVIFRKGAAAYEVALIATKGGTIWTLPKGTINKSEQTEAAAVREIHEETGLIGKIVDSLGDKTYWFYLKEENTKYRKTVTYFLVEYLSGSTEIACSEVDEARWFLMDTAMDQLSYKGDREILEKAKDKLGSLRH